MGNLISALKENPRADAGRIAAAVSLDACVAKATDLIRDLEIAPPSEQVANSAMRETAANAPSGAEEFWITVENPPLKGQLDRVRNGVVAEYKTGTPDPVHTDQLLFYAVLWWLKYDELPQQLELRYPGSVVRVPGPEPEALDAAVTALRSEIESVRSTLSGRTPSARPSAEQCRYCPVRQLCDEYWKSEDTADLRLRTEGVVYKQNPSHFGDVQLNQLPTDRRSDGAVFGEAEADGIGAVRVRLPAYLCPDVTQYLATARILGAKLTKENGERVITASTGAEVFWVSGV